MQKKDYDAGRKIFRPDGTKYSEVDYGVWWKGTGCSRWRVTWYEATEDLCAVELHCPAPRLDVLVPHCSRAEADVIMTGWAESAMLLDDLKKDIAADLARIFQE